MATLRIRPGRPGAMNGHRSDSPATSPKLLIAAAVDHDVVPLSGDGILTVPRPVFDVQRGLIQRPCGSGPVIHHPRLCPRRGTTPEP